MEVTEHTFLSERHQTYYRACGPEHGPLIIMTHGWPELSISWRHQLSFLGDMGYRAVAPDMRGYGGSSIYAEHSAYSQREIVKDMIELIDGLGREKAVWIGHDWG
ncbi:MAG: epoxide hydrolase, partial [Gammaproteobacteria bacterium]|nr:epoxide hydrolase [Gammaproteobacteria bacterium]